MAPGRDRLAIATCLAKRVQLVIQGEGAQVWRGERMSASNRSLPPVRDGGVAPSDDGCAALPLAALWPPNRVVTAHRHASAPRSKCAPASSRTASRAGTPRSAGRSARNIATTRSTGMAICPSVATAPMSPAESSASWPSMARIGSPASGPPAAAAREAVTTRAQPRLLARGQAAGLRRTRRRRFARRRQPRPPRHPPSRRTPRLALPLPRRRYALLSCVRRAMGEQRPPRPITLRRSARGASIQPLAAV